MAAKQATKTVTLAHPINVKDAESLGAEVREYQAGEQVTVPAGQVMRLINSGRVAGVDPDDADAIAELFAPPTAAPDDGAERSATAAASKARR